MLSPAGKLALVLSSKGGAFCHPSDQPPDWLGMLSAFRDPYLVRFKKCGFVSE